MWLVGDLRTLLAGRGFEVSAAASAKITETYGKGYALVSLEVAHRQPRHERARHRARHR